MIGCSGFGSLTLRDASKHRDRDVLRAVAAGGLRILDELPVTKRARCPNQMFHRVVASTFYRVFGAPAGGNDSPDGAIWCPVWLATTSYLARYAVTEFEDGYDMDNGWPPDVVVGGGSSGAWNGMHTASEEAEPHLIWAEPFAEGKLGFRAVYRTVRFLWTKAQCVSTEIRSVYFGMTLQGNGWSTCWDGYGNSAMHPFARIRLLDSGGQPMTLTKTSDEVAVLEYTMQLVSF